MELFDEFKELIKNTEVMSRVFTLLEKEPPYLLRLICEEYESTGNALPDHRLQLNGFIEDIALKAIVAAGLVIREDGGRMSLYQYRPTEEGVKKYHQLKKTGYYSHVDDEGEPANG